MLIKRNLVEIIKPYFSRKEYIAIVGPRQSGKTTFLEILKEYLISNVQVSPELVKIISFEDRRILQEFEENPISFINSWISNSEKINYLLIDEFQYAKDGGQKLKFVYDMLKNVKIIITGSSSLEMASKVKSFMTGRLLTFHMHPFSFSEFLRFKDNRLEKIYYNNSFKINEIMFNFENHKENLSKKTADNLPAGKDMYFEEFYELFDEYCIWGGYPLVAMSISKDEKRKVLSEIFNSYILHDIKGLLDLNTERELFLLAQILATQIGSTVVYNNLSLASGLIYRKMIEHLNILNSTFIIKEVRPYFTNKQKEIVKNPKIYFLDNGFRNYLIENYNNLKLRPDSGQMFEQNAFIRLNEICSDKGQLCFWRTKAGAEVDFVFIKGNELIPIEVKFSEFNKPIITKSLASFINKFKPKTAFVINKNFWGKLVISNTEVVFMPAYYL